MGGVGGRGVGRTLFAPFQVKLGADLPGREPDFFFVAASRLSRLHDTWFEGPPDMVAEVVSHESRGRDRGAKFYGYEAAGVREYWLIDPVRERAEFYFLDEGGKYRAVHSDAGGIFRSTAVPGFWFNVQWLWQNPPPDELDLLAEILR